MDACVLTNCTSSGFAGTTMSSKDSDRITAAQQTLDSMSQRIQPGGGLTTIALFDISQLLNTQLDKETLATCVGMIESGVNPEALAVRPDALPSLHVVTICKAVIQELRREAAALSGQSPASDGR